MSSSHNVTNSNIQTASRRRVAIPPAHLKIPISKKRSQASRRAPTRRCVQSTRKEKHPGASPTGHPRLGTDWQAEIPTLRPKTNLHLAQNQKINATLAKVRRHAAKAKNNTIEAVTQEKSKVNIFLQFCKATDHPPLESLPRNPSSLTQLYEDYIFWLQRVRKISSDFKSIKAYTATVTRLLDLHSDPFESLSKSYKDKLARGFDKHALTTTKPKIAFDPTKLLYIFKQCNWFTTSTNLVIPESPNPASPSFAKFGLQTTFAKQNRINIALLTYKVTGLRPGNVLLGTGDNRHIHVLKIRNILSLPQSGKGHPKAPIFILNDGKKGSKKPIITAIPFNPTYKKGNTMTCAATGLLQLRSQRMKEGASSEDPLFMNPFSNTPLSTSVANRFIQDHLKVFFTKRGEPAEWASFYSLKSLRKALASRLEELGCSPQTIAKQLHHSSLNSQMSYICTFFNKKHHLIGKMYN